MIEGFMIVDDNELNRLIISMATCFSIKEQGKCNDGDCMRCQIGLEMLNKFMRLPERGKTYVKSKAEQYAAKLSADYKKKRYSFDSFLQGK